MKEHFVNCQHCVGIACECCNGTGKEDVSKFAAYVLLAATAQDRYRRFMMTPSDYQIPVLGLIIEKFYKHNKQKELANNEKMQMV